MKHLTFLFLFVASIATAQTANYTASEYETKTYNNSTYVWELYDTLSGTNDTLIITLSPAFYGHYGYRLDAKWLTTGTTLDSKVVLDGRCSSNQDWSSIGTATFDTEDETATAFSMTTGTEGATSLRIKCISASGVAHLRVALTLIRL